MRKLAFILALVAVVTTGACGSDGSRATEQASDASGERNSEEGPSFPNGRLLIDTGSDSVLVDVEVADTEGRRAYGLMNRDSLPPDSGMVFLYFEDSTGGFWMKNTRIPLSIAFFDVDGEILEILDMEPCRSDPCTIYDPGVAYRGALEVNQGAFDRWNVTEGDTINLIPRSQ